ncbi:MAG: DUF4332 domain-containing protein [Gemmatimonadetes bacterium]|nr:DUF4332 domain-containing protein [Gemmatimonadota bacterium]
MGYDILEVEGIGPDNACKLGEVEIRSTDDFLFRCGSKPARVNVSKRTGIAEKNLRRWANMADLMRINGIGPQYSELLEAAGVDSIHELRERQADRLAEMMKRANRKARLVRATPPVSLIVRWIQEAESMEPGVLD